MSVKIRVSPLLRQFTDGQEVVQMTGHSVIECLHGLVAQFPRIKRWLYDRQGKLRHQVQFYVNGEMIHTNDLSKPLKDGDELLILLAIAGG